MKLVPVMPARLDWPSAIGNFLLNFGHLDHLIFVFLKNHLSPEEFARVKEWHFKDRLLRIAQHLKDRNYSAEQQIAFGGMIERIEPFRELRNHIAHAHLWVGIDLETKKLKVTLFQPKDLDTDYAADAKHVEFEQLFTGMTTIGSVIEEFSCLAGFKTSWSGTIAELNNNHPTEIAG